jgi:redox-sensitive bicupin YhaK (pirin superfamily)
MEIITYVVSGTVEHRDSLGHVEQIGAGEFQRMTAGTGIVHSEYNPSTSAPLHLLQIWIKPSQQGLAPGYEQMTVPPRAGFNWLVSGDHLPGTLHVHQDVRIGRVAGAGAVQLPLAADRVGFLQVVRGEAGIAGRQLQGGDAIAVSAMVDPQATLGADAEVLWFDLPGYPAQ